MYIETTSPKVGHTVFEGAAYIFITGGPIKCTVDNIIVEKLIQSLISGTII